VLLDTQLHVDYFTRTFGLSKQKISAVPVGCNEDFFYPPRKDLRVKDHTNVLYYSSYLPLHGAATVIHAAAHLRDDPICFRLVGDGDEFNKLRTQVEQLGLNHVEFISWRPLAWLADELRKTDIALGGHFGTNDKAGRVVPGKVYQMLASGCALIAGDTPANRELLTNEQSAFLVPPADSEALANAIKRLSRDSNLRKELGSRGRAVYEQRCSEALITRQVEEIILGM
jgi:glycosyltransferase involved in cell wall biosynthesis